MIRSLFLVVEALNQVTDPVDDQILVLVRYMNSRTPSRESDIRSDRGF